MDAKRFRARGRTVAIATLLGASALLVSGCSGGAEPPMNTASAASPGSSSDADSVAGGRPSQSLAPESSPAAATGTFTFDGIDGIRLGMSAADFAAAFPDARFWPLSADDPAFGPGEAFADRLQAIGGDRVCPIVGTPFDGWTEVQFENGVVVAIIKRSRGGQGDSGPAFTTSEGRTAASTRGDFEAEFGQVLVVQDAGWERWIMKGPDGRTMQLGGIEATTGVPSMAGVMDANHSMRLVPKDWSACQSVVNGAPETA